jgi:hypothetical protein
MSGDDLEVREAVESALEIRCDSAPVVDPDTGFTTLAVDHFSNALNYGIAVEYSNFYLRANIHDFGLPEWVNRLTPLVEFRFTTPVTDRYGEKTVGRIRRAVGAEHAIPQTVLWCHT